MAAKILSALVLAVAVLAPSALAKHCEDENGIEHFDVTWLCGQTFFISHTSYNAQEVDCAFGKVVCGNDGTVIFQTFVRRNNVMNFTSTSTLTPIKNTPGVLIRKYQRKDSPVIRMIIKSYTEFLPDETGNKIFKMTYIVCAENTDDVLMKAIITNCQTCSLWDERRAVLTAYEDNGLAMIPNICHREEYFED